MNKKCLILLATEFPYKNGETFLEKEIDFLSNKFEFIFIFSVYGQRHMQKKRKTKSNVFIFPLGLNHNRIKYMVKGLFFVKSFYSFHNIYVKKKPSYFYFLGKNMTISHKASMSLDYYLSLDYEYYVYSYWLTLGLAAIDLSSYIMINTNKKPRLICRCHRYDVYNELYKSKHIPFQEEVIKKVDNVYCCSDHANRYLAEKYPYLSKKLFTSRLFSIDYGIQQLLIRNIKIFVTVSGFKRVKRLDLFAAAFSRIAKEQNNVNWVAFGDGKELGYIKRMIADSQVQDKVFFKGNVPNSDIYDFYKNTPVYFFCNVSSSEGIPVSIMEACSFGIPILATDVGGTSEIVGEENGYLINKDITVDKLVGYLNNCLALDDFVYLNMRNSSRKKWEDKYNASKNLESWYNTIVKKGF